MTSEPGYTSGPFRIFPSRQELLRDGVPVALGGRAFDLLCALIDRPGEVVSKRQLFAAVWPGSAVEESNLSVTVSVLRRALGCGVGGTRYIATVPGRGYRFVAPVVREVALAASPPEPEPKRETGNLPAPVGALIGRDRDLDVVLDLLGQARLVSLIGAGGVGKTRLALAVGQAARADWPDGVWFVELAALSSPELVAEAVAAGLGRGVSDRHSATSQVVAYLRKSRALLLLDNCEHLLNAAASFAATVLAACPDVTVLATSREALKVAGERSYLVPSLPVPDRADAATAETALRHGAVRLLVERAAALGGYRLTDSDAPLVGEICRRLDGIAFALELAAPRLRMIGAAGLRRRLDERFLLLTGGSRTALPRHQTLRALIDWSHDLLTDEERALMRQLSVFAGGWTLEAAAAVGASDEWIVLDRLTSLVDKSLVQAESHAGGMRYRFLESTRHYAAEKLREAGEAEAFRRQLRYLAERMAEAEASYETTPTAPWLDSYAAELDNVRGALDWAFGPSGDVDLGVALAAHCRALWLELSHPAEHRRWLDLAAEHIHSGTPSTIASRVYATRAHGISPGLRGSAADGLKAVDLARQSEEPLVLALALVGLAQSRLSAAEAGEAARVLDEALDAARPMGNTKLLAGMLGMRAIAAWFGNDEAAARRLCEQGIAVARATGGGRALLVLLSNQAEFRFAAGDLDGAIDAARQAIDSGWIDRSQVNDCNTGINLGAYILVRGGTADAASRLARGLAAAQSLDDDFLAGNAIQHLALVAARRGDVRTAALLLGHVEAAVAAAGNERHATERATAELLRAEMARSLSEPERVGLLAEGAALPRDDAVALALALGRT